MKHDHHHHSGVIAGDIAIVIGCVGALALATALFLLCRKRRHIEDTSDDTSITAMLQVRPIPLTDIELATDGFHRARIVGKGRFWTVYKAVSSTGDVFAVKRVHPSLVLSNPGLSFSSKIKSLSFADHPNVVPVLGYSEAPGERIILTEYVDMKSLEDYLHGTTSDGKPLSWLLNWSLRVRIAAGAARGVEHLHGATVLGIMHGCIKASNVMVDVNYVARVCDYGLAFLLGPGSNVCVEDDVYAFGLVLLELLSGRRCEDEGKVVEWALTLIRESRVEELLDPRIAVPLDGRALARMAKVASACVGNGRKSRPSMAQVAAILSSLELQPCV
ncbi:serine/threonine-protein kinase-like protein CCR1 [Typha angustifolia]|uniref:serine/threonine-protein kinase-like protein CCR1 n=1 Tax=Typha angustifolia TaxID=59011 RepID=UPI003C2E6BD4